MSQLTQLIEQARNRRGINDLFKTKVDALTFSPENKANSNQETLTEQLETLEQMLFEKKEVTDECSEEFLKSLEEILEIL